MDYIVSALRQNSRNLFLIYLLLTPTSGSSEVLYARPDGDAASGPYLSFEKIRDNAIEPEGRAEYWIIKHNAFLDVYAAISTDGVAGRDFLVFGNVFALDIPPEPVAATRAGREVGNSAFLGGGGRWSTAAAEGDDALCSTHVLRDRHQDGH